MLHLSNIGLKNFRVFKDLTEFNFAPITVLTGTNNSGKSSLLKALLLLKDNWKRYDNLDFSGSQHLLGNYTSTVHNNKAENNITFQLPFSLPAIGSNLYLELVYKLNKSNELKNGILKEYRIINKITGKKIFSIGNNPYSPEVRLDFDFFISGIKNYQNEVDSYHSKRDIKVERQFELERKKKRTRPEEEELQKLLKEEVTKIYNLDDLINYRQKIFLDSGNQTFWKLLFTSEDGSLIETRFHSHESILFYPFLYLEDITRKYNLDDTKINNIIVSWAEMQDEIKTYENNEAFNLQEYLESRSSDFKGFGAVLFIGEELAILNTIKEKYQLKSTEELYDKFIVDEIAFIQQRINNPTINDIFSFFQHLDLSQALNHSISAVLRTGLHGKFDPNFRMEDNAVFDYFNLRKNSISHFASLDLKDLNINRDNYNILVTYFDKGIELAEREIELFLNNFSTLQTIRSLTQREFSLQNSTQSFENLLHNYHGFSINIEKYRLEFVNKWLKKFGINETIKIEISDEGKWSKILLGERNLADYGFGLSQLIPILLKIYMMSISGRDYENSIGGYSCGTLYIEEPETNLHPRLQSLLADVFYEAAQEYHIQFIIETHSEYLIRKLQYLTAKKKIKPEDTIIYYFNDPDKIPKGEKQVREIRIKEDGSLTDDFGPGFFDEADNIALELYRLQRNKAIKN